MNNNDTTYWFYKWPLGVRIALCILFWWIFVPIAAYPVIKPKLRIVALIVWLAIALPIGNIATLIVIAVPLAIITPSPEKTEQVADTNPDLQKQLDEEKRLREEAETKAKEEEEKRIQVEKQINEAQTINQEITFDDADNKEGNQEVALAQQANVSIATLGFSTQDKKLFDVTSVVDGDTIKVSELGTLRLIGMDTPETKDPRKPVQCFGKEASARASELLAGRKVYLEFDPANRIDKYGRTLAYVYREDGYFFNKQMIAEGYANSYTKYPHPKMDEFNVAQIEARNAQSGLWSSGTCNGDTTQAAVQPVVAPEPTYTAPAPQPSTTYVAPAPTPAPATGGYISGTCGDLNARGLGNFLPGDPNYTASRDRDKDGIACEF